MKNNARMIIFSLILGVCSSAMLTVTARFTAPYRHANEEADRMRNILDVLSVPFPAEASGEILLKIAEEKVSIDSSGPVMLYRHAAPGGVLTAIAFSGPGLWGPVEGFLALRDDGVTIDNISYYRQEETPGLGGEIVSAKFRDGFKGKKIVDSQGNDGIAIVRGNGAVEETQIDGISGATMTCNKVEAMINTAIKQYHTGRGGK